MLFFLGDVVLAPHELSLVPIVVFGELIKQDCQIEGRGFLITSNIGELVLIGVIQLANVVVDFAYLADG